MLLMNIKDYQYKALKTMADQEYILKRLVVLGPKVMQLQNGLNGLVDEVGEIANVVKGHIEYGRPLNMPNLREEIGDAMWRLAQLADAIGTDLETCAESNIDKLHKVRYPAGYSEKAAQEENRDRKAEAEIMEQNGLGWAEPPLKG